jgi:Putative transposase
VLEYLSRYTHRVAISNDRLLRLEGDRVVFSYRDSTADSRRLEMELSAEEFIRRFLLHILPDGFVRIRSYGLLAAGTGAGISPSAASCWERTLGRRLELGRIVRAGASCSCG